MNSKALLDQLLKSGQELLGKKSPTQGAEQGSAGLGDLLSGSGLSGLLSSKGGTALAAGALGLLLGSKKGRSVGKKVATYGGLAALGVLAYKAYGNWQAKQGSTAVEPQTVDRVPAQQAEQHSQAILRAMVAAAKADGHIDGRERELLEDALSRLAGSDQELQAWLQQEINSPLNPALLAQAATTPEMAAEMYLASVLVVDEEHFLERAYLDELARQLKLDPALKVELEAQVRQGAIEFNG